MSKYYTSNTFGTNEEYRISTVNHIIKTLNTLSSQFLFTFGCILLTTYVSSIYNFVLNYLLHIVGLGIAGSLLMVLFISFSDRKTIGQLAAFTFFETLSLCAVSIMYGETTIVLGLLATIGISVSLACYALTTNKNFTTMSSVLLMALTSLCFLGLMNLFLRSPIFHAVGMYLGIMVFSLYIIYDVQLYLTEKCKQAAFMDDTLYIEASLNIYLDVINLLLRLWELIAIITKDEKKIRLKK